MINSIVKDRDYTPLVFLLLILIPLYGGYHMFSLFFAGAYLSICLFLELFWKKSIPLPSLPILLSSILIALGHFGSLFTSPHFGMSLIGFFRIIVWILYLLYIQTYSYTEKEVILKTIAYEGVFLSAFNIILFLGDDINLNGRIDGPFQYANTWALYLLICVMLLGIEKKRNIILSQLILILGIFLTGSRSTILLLFLYIIGILVQTYQKQNTKFSLTCLAGLLFLILLSNILSDGLLFARVLSMFQSFSSFNGRILYTLDGIDLFTDYPLGVGYGSYFYLQPTYQTGVYISKYVHNEYLQIAIDGGILALFGFVALCILFVKQVTSSKYRAILLCIMLHILMDFDFQFLSIVFLFFLIGSMQEKENENFIIKKYTPFCTCMTMFLCCFSYFTIVYVADFYENETLSYKLFPHDLSIAEQKLQSCNTFEEAVLVAEKIVAQTEYSIVAWDCLYQNSFINYDVERMLQTKFSYLLLNQYRLSVYEDFVSLLNVLSRQENFSDLASLYAQYTIDILEEVNRKTRPISYTLYEQPDLNFSKHTIEQLLVILKEKKGD